jgi:hypothetical protein
MVSASRPGYSMSAARSVTIGPDETGVDFTASPALTGFTISGNVQRTGGYPVGGAVVTATGNGGTFTDASDPAGDYAIQSLPTGTYSVVATKVGFSPGSVKRVTVGPDASQINHTLGG